MGDLYLKPVRLQTTDHRDEGVDVGSVGVVVEDWGDGFYEVEFSNRATGETIALLTLPENEIELVERAAVDRNARTGD